MFPEDIRNRRQFLQHLGWLLAAGVSGTFSAEGSALSKNKAHPPASPAVPAIKKPSYHLAPWTGDDFTKGHELRDGNLPVLPKKAERTVDFVIVGGGIAGLTSAYYLRDHNFLLLEQYDELGGQSRGRDYRGIDYSLGAAYIGSTSGIYGELFNDLNIEPVKMLPERNSWYWEKKWFPGIDGNEQSSIYKQFDKFIDDGRPIWKSLHGADPRLPVTDSDLLKLDSTLFSSYLQSYDPKFVSLMDSFCKSSACADSTRLSALAGFAITQDLIWPSYVFKGGNSAIATALKRELDKSGSGRYETGSFVWSIDLKNDGASVVYSDRFQVMHRIDCKHIIVTAPPLVAARIIQNLDDKITAQLLSFKFGSYLVANFCMRHRVFNGAYDNWVGSPFSFTDTILAETPYMATNTYSPGMGSVLTVYQPYEPGSQGRSLLLVGNKEEFASSLVDQLSSIVDQFNKNLDQVVLTRWGHAMAIAKPGYFARLNELRSLNTGPLTLAHNSMEGMPSAESAISAARYAANRALKIANPT